jgi:hypothetical protein
MRRTQDCVVALSEGIQRSRDDPSSRNMESAMASFSLSAPKALQFRVDKEHLRQIEVERGVHVYHIYPTLDSWIGRETPDDVNPRSHEDNALTGGVPRQIEETLKGAPLDFYLANRGGTLLARSLKFDKDRGLVRIELTDFNGEDAIHGMADGGTTDAVIARVQQEAAEAAGLASFKAVQAAPAFLKKARFHLEVIVGLENRDRIRTLVQGRNTSRQVKSWTIAEFQGHFDWIKDVLESEKSRFKGRVGYEENDGAPVTILEVLAILTLFHRDFDTRGQAPTVAYSSKGKLDKRLVKFAEGYQSLAPILEDLLMLHDHVYVHFEDAFKLAFPKGKIGARGPREDKLFIRADHVMPLSGTAAPIQVHAGFLYPVLAAHRALVRYKKTTTGPKATWRTDPFKFFDKHGGDLIDDLFSQMDAIGDNPNQIGKQKSVYTALHNTARLIVADTEST